MRLLIIGHTAHYERNGRIAGWGPTVREVDWLRRAFDGLTHLACFHPGPAPDSALEYQSQDIEFRWVPPAGGLGPREKLRALGVAPQYIRAVLRALPNADVIQIRAPGILAMYAMVLVGLFSRKPRWVKYAGNWVQDRELPVSFAFQRWWLKSGLSRGPVTVNGRWPGLPAHIYPFDNPSFSLDEVQQARQAAAGKALTNPIRCVFVGNVEAAKGIGVALEAVQRLHESGLGLRIDIVGDGPQRPLYQQVAQDLGIEPVTTFHGWLPHERVRDLLADAHFILLPSASEGWPKVLSEAMAYGAVPIASRVSAIPQILAEVDTGYTLHPKDAAAFAAAVSAAVRDPEGWKRMSLAGIEAAPRFTYERYLLALDELFRAHYHTSLLKPEVFDEIQERIEEFERVRD